MRVVRGAGSFVASVREGRGGERGHSFLISWRSVTVTVRVGGSHSLLSVLSQSVEAEHTCSTT